MSHAARVLTHRALRRRHLIGLVVIATLVVWGGLWAFAAYSFNQTVTRWVEAGKASGNLVLFSNRGIDGTPFSVHVHLEQFAASSKNGSSLKAGEAVLYMDLWDWSAYAAKLRDGIEGVVAGMPFTAGSLKFGVVLPSQPPLDHTETGLTLWLQPLALTLKTAKPLPFGQTIEEAAFQIRIMGPVPDFSDKDSIAAWNEASGVFEFERFNLRWGPVAVKATGTLGLDPRLQPEGAFAGRIEGLTEAFEALLSQGVIENRQIALLQSSLNVLGRPTGPMGEAASIVPMSVQAGGVYLGPVKLLSFPEISW